MFQKEKNKQGQEISITKNARKRTPNCALRAMRYMLRCGHAEESLCLALKSPPAARLRRSKTGGNQSLEATATPGQAIHARPDSDTQRYGDNNMLQ